MASKQTKTPRQGKAKAKTTTKPVGQGLEVKDSNKVNTLPSKNNHKVNKEEALVMALKGDTQAKIAARYGVSVPAISKLLKPHMDRIRAYQAFKEDPATVYEATEHMILTSVNADDIKKMSGYQKVGSAALLRDKVRLERGKATQITQSIQYILSQIEYEDKTSGKHPANITPQVGSQTHPDNTTLISVDQA